MRILLINTQANYPYKSPCLDLIAQGPAYIAGMLKSKGHIVKGINTSWIVSDNSSSENLKHTIKQNVYEFEPDIIATGGMVAEYLFVRDSIKFSRELSPNTPIICGGSILTNDKASFEVLKPDFGIMDEGEFPVTELVDAINGKKNYENINNLAFWKDGRAIYNSLRNANYGLDEIPYPDYDALEIEKYFELSNQLDNSFHVRTQKYPRMLPLSSGRSCPFKCTFCQYSTLDGSRRKYRGRSMKSVVDEIIFFKSKYDFNILKIYDDLFSVKSERIYEFCDLLKKSSVKINWNASMRVGDVTPDLLKTMKDSGCIHIGYGFESADDGVLKSMNKQITQKQIFNAIEMTENVKLGVQANFIYGDPNESIESIKNTKEFHEKYCMDHIVHNDYVMPYPGSPIFDHSMNKGLINNKTAYCETLHLRPRYNMTKMQDKEFNENIEPIIKSKLFGCKFAEVKKFSIDRNRKFDNPYFKSKIPYNVNLSCPHCKTNQDVVLPIQAENLNTWEGKSKFLNPIRYFCNECHKNYLISFLDLVDLKDNLYLFIENINNLINEDESFVVAPTTSYDLIDSLKAHGLKFENIKINSFLHCGVVTEGMQYSGYPCYELNEQNVSRNCHLKHIILPHQSSNEIFNQLIYNGIPSKNIISMNVNSLPLDEFVKENLIKINSNSIKDNIIGERFLNLNAENKKVFEKLRGGLGLGIVTRIKKILSKSIHF